MFTNPCQPLEGSILEQSFYLAIIFFFIALVYSSVGFGGGSSYLAILIIAGIDIFLLRSTALMCNIIVTSTGTLTFYKRGYLDIKKVLPLTITSIPLAFAGGYLPLRAPIIFMVLGFALIVASSLLWFGSSVKNNIHNSIPKRKIPNEVLGGGIGFLSGMVGIGGGIFLSPILHLINWDHSKKIAAAASFFILVNSIAGLLGQWLQHSTQVDLNWSWPLLLAVLLGGKAGTQLSVYKFKNIVIKKTTAFLILIASLKILNDHLFHFDILF